MGVAKVPSQCPTALEVKIGWKQGKALRSEEIACREQTGVCSRGSRWASALDSVLGGQRYEEISIAFGGAVFWRNSKVIVEEGCTRSILCDVGFEYQSTALSKFQDEIHLNNI